MLEIAVKQCSNSSCTTKLTCFTGLIIITVKERSMGLWVGTLYSTLLSVHLKIFDYKLYSRSKNFPFEQERETFLTSKFKLQSVSHCSYKNVNFPSKGVRHLWLLQRLVKFVVRVFCLLLKFFCVPFA